jgi:hypothetical protein
VKIIAIDPGNTASAWCVLDNGEIRDFGKEPNSDMLIRARREWSPVEGDLLAVEMIASYGMAVGREVFETCLWIGRFIEAWERRQGEYKLIYRKDVKVFHCESTRATDANIRAALLDHYGPGREKAIGTKREPGPLYGVKGDCWAALAVARTAAGNGVTSIFKGTAVGKSEVIDRGGLPF